MKLLTKELEATLPPLYATENDADPIVRAKFFTPDSNWTWFATEGSPVDEDGIMIGPGESEKPAVDFYFFGLVIGHYTELGYFALSELEKARGPLGLRIERDLYFKPTLLSVVRERHS